MQAMQRCIRSTSSNTSCEILPLPSVYGLSIDVVGFSAHEAGFSVRKVDRRKIVEEVYPIEGIHLLQVRQVHGCRGPRKRGPDNGKWQGRQSNKRMPKEVAMVAMRPGRDNVSELARGGQPRYSVDTTFRNGRVAESRGHWRQWLRRCASEVFAVMVVHVRIVLGSAVCKALLTKGVKVTSIR